MSTFKKINPCNTIMCIAWLLALVLLASTLYLVAPKMASYFSPSVTDFKITKYERDGPKLRIFGTMSKSNDGCKYVGPSVYDVTKTPAVLLKTSRTSAGKIRLPGLQEWGPTTIYGIPPDAKKLEYSMTHDCGFYTKSAKYQTIDLESIQLSPWTP